MSYEKYGKLLIGGKQFKACFNFGARVEMEKAANRAKAEGRAVGGLEATQNTIFSLTRCGGAVAPTMELIVAELSWDEAIANIPEIERVMGLARTGGVPEGNVEASSQVPATEAKEASGTQETSSS